MPRTADPAGDEATRSIAVYNDKVIVPTMQGKLYGLDARTGKIVWQSWISDPSKPDEGTARQYRRRHCRPWHRHCRHGQLRPHPAENHCYISAYDANTGAALWKFLTVALKAEPQGDTWGRLPDDQRAGAETWVAGTFDPHST